MKPQLIIMSHGLMAQEVLNSAEIIVGKIPDVKVISITPEDGIEEINKRLETIITNLEDKEILVLVDLLGGTPYNIAVRTLYQREKSSVISGLNLSMVIEYALSTIETANELADYLIQAAVQNVQKFVVTPLKDSNEYEE